MNYHTGELQLIWKCSLNHNGLSHLQQATRVIKMIKDFIFIKDANISGGHCLLSWQLKHVVVITAENQPTWSFWATSGPQVRISSLVWETSSIPVEEALKRPFKVKPAWCSSALSHFCPEICSDSWIKSNLIQASSGVDCVYLSSESHFCQKSF